MHCSHCGAESLKSTSKFCDECGGTLEPSPGLSTLGQYAAQSERRSRTGRLVAFAVAGTLALACLGYGGYYSHKAHQQELARVARAEAFRAKLEEAIGRDSGYTETILKVEKDSSNITYKELFELCDKSIADRTNLIIELRGLSTEIDSTLRDELIDFLNHENELVRAKRQVYRSQMEFSSKLKVWGIVFDTSSYSEYLADYYVRQRQRYKKEMREVADDMESSATTFSTAYAKLVDEERSLGERLRARGIRFNEVFASYRESNDKLADTSRESVKTIRDQLT